MQSKIFDSSAPVSAGKHPRASQTAAPIDLIGPKTQASGHASSKVKESEMAKNDKSFQGITKFDPFPSAVESTFAEGKKSSKPLRSLSHDGADLVPQNEGILPPFSPSPASRSRTTATRSSNGSRVSQNSRHANSTLEVTRKRPTGVGDEKTSAKRRRLESPKRPSGTSPKSKPVTFSPSTSRSGQKIHKSSNKKRGRLPTPPALSDQLSTDFGIVLASQPELNRRPRPTPLAKHPRSSPHTSPIIPETDDILREAEGVTIPPTRRGRVSNMINEDGSEDTPGTNDPKVITPRADSPPKSASFAMTESALEHSEPQTGISEGPSGKTHTIHVKVEDSLIDGNDGTPEVSKKRKNKKAPWEQPNFPSSDPPNKFDIRLPPEPRYAAPQVSLMDEAIKDSKAGPARIEPISGSVDLNEALETSAPLSHRKPTMPRSPAPAKTVSERDRSELHVSRSTKRGTSFDIGKETPGEPTRSLSAAMAVWDPTHNTSSNKGGLWVS
ncbi:uncharacterized protein EI90DRAFT_2120275 [Cantharellus anzutake]|uniref:uncharacterized protein n=1 Tax=Cantharellus anzutake TaxID=1750568 RepID=UPI0019070920|nr:uncharacterized protein EI90DRAFT_2120275 [Cantharellus anzutake]KAF8325545.1 hypothetical protein EI90DRAFT_2120275 [Cantharellus anzutake]